MTNTDRAGAVGVLVLVAGFLAAAMEVQAARERVYPKSQTEEDALYVTSERTLRRLSGPFAALTADVYWIRALQYYGRTKQRLAASGPTPAPPSTPVITDRRAYSLLHPLLDITTSLDPRFDIAYRFGSVFLAEPYPRGAGRPDLAVELLEKGLRGRPDKWEYMEDIGFVHYWYDHDYQRAARAFEKAAEVPGAPVWLKPLAATTAAQGGDRRSSRVMWLAILQSADIDWVRQQAEHRLRQLDALDEMDDIQLRLNTLARLRGSTPSDWATVLGAPQMFPRIPRDPSDTPYQLTPDGHVRLSDASPLNPLPVEPAKLGPS